jgi:uncharacterized protein DUF6768
MDKLDKMISEALDDEDREILDKIGQEQSFPKQALGLFQGRTGWLNGIILFAHLIFLACGVYAGWYFFIVDGVLEALRWGLPSAVLLVGALVTRITLLRSMQTNNVLHAVKRLEMQVALLAAKR